MLRVKDVGRIELGAQNYALSGRLNGKPAALIALYQLPGSNAIAAAEGAKKMMKKLSEKFPADLAYVVCLDTTLAVTEGMAEIIKTLEEALVLVILVVFIFLQGWRATLIPLLAVPVSLVGTFALFPLFGFTVNTLSLFGLVLAIGLVVDDAIVVVEAVEHHIEHGLSPKEATFKAMQEVSGPVIAIALILAAVFVPTAFIPGITGRLYQQFAVTIAVSVIISAFNALTLSPALSALLLRPKKKGGGPLQKFFDWFNRAFGAATNGYVGVCRFLIHKSLVAVILLVGFTFLTGMLGKRIPGSFLPEEDQGYFFAQVILPDAASFQRTDEAMKQCERDSAGHTRRRVCQHGHRLQHPHRGEHELQRHVLHLVERMGRSQGPGGAIQRHPQARERRPQAGARRGRIRFFAARHSRHRRQRRRDVPAAGSFRQGCRFPRRKRREVRRSRA